MIGNDQKSIPSNVLLAGREESVESMLDEWLHEVLPLSEMSPKVMAALAGKRFALIGFDIREAASLADVLGEAQAFSRLLPGSPAVVSPEALRPFDIVILRVGEECELTLRENPEFLANYGKPLLLVGSPKVLFDVAPVVREYADDFQTTPWTAEEITLRIYHLISDTSRKSRAGGNVPADGPVRVLVADDDPTTTALESAILRKHSMECHIARDGGQALAMVRELRPHALVLDVNMPQKDGFEVLAAIKNDPDTSAVAVIMLTSCQQESDIVRGFGLGADDYIVKPFNPMELVARLKRLLRRISTT